MCWEIDLYVYFILKRVKIEKDGNSAVKQFEEVIMARNEDTKAERDKEERIRETGQLELEGTGSHIHLLSIIGEI